MDKIRSNKYFWEKDLEEKYRLNLERFSLLVLEPGETYFEDFSVFYSSTSNKKKQKGRLKICSKSLLFDPLDSEFPLIKLLCKDFVQLIRAPASLLKKDERSDEMFIVETKQFVCMKEGNTIAPYQNFKEKQKHYFNLNFVSLNEVLPRIEQLYRASTLGYNENSEMINTIIQAKQYNLKFDTSWLEDLYEGIVTETTASKIQPLVCNPGRILLTSLRLYFQPFNNIEANPVLKWKLSDIRHVVKRRYLLRHVGLELIMPDSKKDAYFIFQTKDERDDMYHNIIQQNGLQTEFEEQDHMTMKWQNGNLSNYDYLIYLNSKADRSFNDLTQYPVFPWIIQDYSSNSLDLQNPDTFRDLTKPIGALDENRLNQLKSRSETMAEPKFLYGSHYSSPGFVLFYLVRVAPEYMLCLQNGKFDHPDRLFNSMSSTWKNCCTGYSDFKELIPEFYDSDGAFLENLKQLKLGIKHDGSQVNDVILPPWANDSKDFIKKCREALECDYVSERIHHWIDLVFGYKQTGDEAWKADNVFYYLTYEGAVDLDNLNSVEDKLCYEAQIMEFGQTPKQLFKKPHPKRTKNDVDSQPVHQFSIDSLSLSEEVPSNSNQSGEEKFKQAPEIEIPTVELNEIISPVKMETTNEPSNLKWVEKIGLSYAHKLHKGAIYDIGITRDGKFVYSVSLDTQLKMFSLEEKKQIRSMGLSNMSLACCLLLDDEKHILIGSWDNNIYTYSIDFARAINSTQAHHDAVTKLRHTKDYVISSSWDSTVKVWKFSADSSSKFEFFDELDHDTEVMCCDVHTDVNNGTAHLVTGTKDGTIFIWDLSTFSLQSQLQLHTDEVTGVLYSKDGSRILTCSTDQYIKVIDISTEVEVFSKEMNDPIKCSCWDGQIVILGMNNGDVIILDLINPSNYNKLKSHKGAVHSLAVCQKGKFLVSGGEDGYLAVWR